MEGAAQTILSNAGQLLSEEYRLLRGVGGEVAELRYDLATMNALLRMQSEAEDGAADHFVREWMRQLREVAYDSEDCVDLYRLRIKSRPSDGVLPWLGRLLETTFPRHRLAGEIRALRARATAISERHARYGVNRDALRRSSALSTPPVLLSASASTAEAFRRSSNDDTAGGDREQLVGIAKQAEALVARLQPVPREEAPQPPADAAGRASSPKVLPIVGFGGVGKTTLAMELCRRLEAAFPYQAMVSVSQAFEPSRDMESLLKRVLEQVVSPMTQNENGIDEEGALNIANLKGANEMAKKLHDILQDKRYLIMVDDVWSINAWEQIQSRLPETNNCGGKLIIVTTRIDSVAKACSSAGTVNGQHGYIHQMEALGLEDSKKLFLSKVFGSTNAKYPEVLEEVMGNILDRCGGLPLAIVSIASVLAGYKSAGSIDKWQTVCRSIGSQMESNPTLEGMRHIVTLSYNHLPHELKNCMMYLSIFPEDYEINKDRLLGRWIAEGLVPEKRGMTPMEVAESYLEELVSRNMVIPRFGFDDKVESCRVHDVLLEVMVCKALECNFVSLLGGQYAEISYGRIRRLSIHGGGEDDGIQGGGDDNDDIQKAAGCKLLGRIRRLSDQRGCGTKEMDVEHARSLSMFQVLQVQKQKAAGRKLLDQLGRFTLLRVLDLEDCEALTNNHMEYVCRLYLLRFLSIKGTDVSVMPPEVGKLEHLQTLDARFTLISELPETMTRLEKLECLKFINKTAWYVWWTLPRGISKMKALREVGLYAHLTGDIQVAEEFGELQKLQSVVLSINCGNDSPMLPVLADSLGKLHSLRRLDVVHTGASSQHFICKLPAPPRLLRFLRFEGSAVSNFPSWIESLIYLAEIHINNVRFGEQEVFGVLCRLPSLKSIWFEQHYERFKDQELVARTGHCFPALSNIIIVVSSAPQLKVVRFEEGSMTKLQTLCVMFSNVERSIVGIEHLTSLKEVVLVGTKDDKWLHAAVGKVKEANSARSQKFRIVVKW